ncbi:MAG: hypothetical protein HFF18_00610 [Oscillospiraceae bacterium]|nr:hypothetical protein [Oscillospiraceae bacterium]
MPKRKRKQVYLPEISATASSCDCTGLMPTPPQNEAQQESYQSLTSTALPKPDR